MNDFIQELYEWDCKLCPIRGTGYPDSKIAKQEAEVHLRKAHQVNPYVD